MRVLWRHTEPRSENFPFLKSVYKTKVNFYTLQHITFIISVISIHLLFLGPRLDSCHSVLHILAVGPSTRRRHFQPHQVQHQPSPNLQRQPLPLPRPPATTTMAGEAPKTKLLWNADNVKDVAESVGISSLNDEALKALTQDVEYRIGQVIIEALRLMRAARRTTLTVNDVSLALRVLDVEPLYGYDSTRPLRYGEASMGPGQPLFYIEDEEVDFEKLINAPLPKVPRDMNFTGITPRQVSFDLSSTLPLTESFSEAHWLAIEGVQPSIPQNPTTAESRSQELLPKGPGANPALAALAGNDNVAVKPSVKHIVSKELILYFDKIQAAILDENPDEEVVRLRHAALGSVRDDPGLHQLVPYFINFIMDRVTHNLDDTFTLKQMMELTNALIENKSLFLDPYASSLSAPGSDVSHGPETRLRRRR